MSLLLLLLMSRLTLGLIDPKKDSCPKLYDYPFRQINPRCYNSGNVGTTTQQLLDKNHYSYETHTVTTDDGYEIDIFRIGMSANSTKGVVFMAPAFFCSSDWWVNTDGRSLAFNLPGYEVWLTNRRGTPYSRNDGLTPDEFYNFTLDQLAVYDTRALLKYVVKVSGQPVHFIGFSEGNTLVFMYASQFPEEAGTLIKGIYAVLADTYFDGAISPVLELCPVLVAVHKAVASPCLFYPTQFLTGSIKIFCTYFPYACRLLINLLQGKTVQFAAEDLLNFYSRFPAKLSYGECMHFYQIYKTGQLKKYDYGTQNKEVYGQPMPPEYHLGNIKIPTTLFWSTKDVHETKEGVSRVCRELGGTYKKMVQIPPPNNTKCKPYNHVDFYMSETNLDCFYPYLLENMEQEENVIKCY